MTAHPPSRVALRGDLLDFTGAPEWAVIDSSMVRFRPDHWLLIENGRITGAQPDKARVSASRPTVLARRQVTGLRWFMRKCYAGLVTRRPCFVQTPMGRWSLLVAPARQDFRETTTPEDVFLVPYWTLCG